MTTSPSINFGNLKGLIGSWTGSNGINLIAVPDQSGEFKLLIAPYSETLNINGLPATTPNRGLQTIQQNPTLSYNTNIMDISNPAEPKPMHAENGFWSLMINSTLNNNFDIFRLSTIPHGDSLVAMGNSSVISGAPSIDTSVNALPFGDLPDRNGYNDLYTGVPIIPGFFPTSPNMYLVDYLNKQINNGYKVMSTTILQVSTNNQGAINNIPFLNSNVNATQFDATFWIETIQKPDNSTFLQLQYSQRTLLQFPIKENMSGQIITWPHFNVNTLTLAK